LKKQQKEEIKVQKRDWPDLAEKDLSKSW
jgi:hypothetical protein